MRTAGLFILAILLPLSAYAALININTADAALLDTLPGIGPTYAARIVDYRTAHGPFARIEDIQNVSGIGPSTYAQLSSLITVGETSTSSAMTASSTQSAPAASGSASTYVPPPAALSVEVSGGEEATLEVPFLLSARATVKGGGLDSAARILWSFGDGSAGEGSAVEKIYHYTGTYLVTVTASDGTAKARDELVVTVRSAKARLLPVTGDGITVANDSNERLDLSGWHLVSDAGSFRIPDGMTILPEASVLFPFTVTNLPVSFDATLRYPDGVVAARTPQAAPALVAEATAQLFAPEDGFNQVQTVESVPNTSISGTAHENTAVSAPRAETELAALGAALPPEATSSRISGLFRSPWTLSFLGLMTLAGGAFILL